MSIQFSLICPSVRPQYWNNICDSLLDNKLEWEILFVGPFPPMESGYKDLPKNARWIETSVKPAQCTHIGFTEARGEFVSITADDCTYFTPNHKGALDNMYNFIKTFPEADKHKNTEAKIYNRDKMVYGFRMFEDRFCAETSHTHYFVAKDRILPAHQRSSSLLYPFFVIANGVYQELGGYDTRFITGQCENDFLFRVHLTHGFTENSLCPTAMVWALHDKHNNSGSFRKYHAKDSETLKKLWIGRKEVTNEEYFNRYRQEKTVNQYINNNTLYTVSQGEKGEWI